MTTEQAAAFLLFALVAAATPGPSNVMLTATGAQVGVLEGLPCLLGVTTGMGLMLFLTFLGLGSFATGGRSLLQALHWCGIAILLWLSWKIAVAPVHVDGASRGRSVGYFGAAVFQWVNPKAWLVIAGAAGTFVTAGGGTLVGRAASMGALFVLAALPGCFVWLAFGAAVRRLLRSPRRARAFNITMGALLATSAALLLR